MPIDVSMYNTKPAESQNPLTMASNAVSMANAMQQNKILQARAQYEEPLLAQQQQQNQLSINKSQADLAMQHYDNMMKFLAPLALKPDLSHDDIIKGAADGIANGMFTAPEATRELSGLSPDNDPAKNQAFVRQFMMRAQSAADQLKQLYGEPAAINTGRGTKFGVQLPSSQGGGFAEYGQAPTGFEKQYMAPGEAAQEREFIDPKTGKVWKGTVGQLTPNSGYNANYGNAASMPNSNSGPSTSGASSGPANASPQLPAGQENIPTGGNIGTNVNAPKNSAATPSTVQPGQFLLSKNAPGVAENMQIAGQDLGHDIQDLKNAPDTLYNMQQGLDALQKAPTGKGSEYRQAIKSAAVALAPDLFKDTDWEHDVQAYDKAEKYLTRQAHLGASAVGPNTNQNLSTTLTGNPNTHMNNLASQDVMKVIIGLKRMNLARTAAFLDQHPDGNGAPQEYQVFGAQFNKNIDPSAFMADMMSKEQLARKYKELGPRTLPDGSPNPKRQKWDNSYNLGVKYGYIDHDALANKFKATQ